MKRGYFKPALLSWLAVSFLPAVEIRVAGRGPGIADQLHGTDPGLSLVKKIVEAPGGSVSARSEPMLGARLIVRLPAAPSELQHEFAHSLG